MRKFKGKTHGGGSSKVTGGRLRGATDTDYFYFLCPQCPDNQMLRILDYENREERPDNPYDDICPGPKAELGFIIGFKLYCCECGLKDFVKVGNLGFQLGKHIALPVVPSASN